MGDITWCGDSLKSSSKTCQQAACLLSIMLKLDAGNKVGSPHFGECVKISVIKSKKEKSTWHKVLILRVSVCLSLMA